MNKSNIVFLFVQTFLDIFPYFIYTSSLVVNKSQSFLNIQIELSKTSYNNYKKSINIIIKFSLKKSFFDLSIFSNRKDPTIKQWLSKM